MHRGSIMVISGRRVKHSPLEICN